METQQVLANVHQGGIIAILRGDFAGAELEIATVLTGEGVRAVEVTLNSPGALRMIEMIASRLGTEFAIGAGTVLLQNEVGMVAGAGASFIVSPNRDTAVIETTKRVGLASFPGCFTPSEIVEARAAGADAIKLFPARLISPELLADLRGPLDGIRFVPTGGIGPDRAPEYRRAGAFAIGVGSGLVNPDVLRLDLFFDARFQECLDLRFGDGVVLDFLQRREPGDFRQLRDRLLDSLKDKDKNTAKTIRTLCSEHRLAEGDLMYARDCASGPGVKSPAAVAVSALQKRAEQKGTR